LANKRYSGIIVSKNLWDGRMSSLRQNKTLMANNQTSKPTWLLLDASGKTLGRFASEISKILLGKHKPDFTPHAMSGDSIIVINAAGIKVTGNKEAQKEYVGHSGFPGGQKRTPYRTMLQRHPDRIITHAVWGMMPRGPRARKLMKRLRVFGGASHGMEAQQPVAINI
jgi:large subunit ribosomal protein L13